MRETMGCYFDDAKSAARRCGNDPQAVISLLAHRFMQENPPAPYVWRTFDERGIQADEKGGYHFDFLHRVGLTTQRFKLNLFLFERKF